MPQHFKGQGIKAYPIHTYFMFFSFLQGVSLILPDLLIFLILIFTDNNFEWVVLEPYWQNNGTKYCHSQWKKVHFFCHCGSAEAYICLQITTTEFTFPFITLKPSTIMCCSFLIQSIFNFLNFQHLCFGEKLMADTGHVGE